MAGAHEAVRLKEIEVRRETEEARQQAVQAMQLLNAETVEARLDRLEINQRAPVGDAGACQAARIQVTQYEIYPIG